MSARDQRITKNWAIYNGDSTEILTEIPSKSIGLSIYSPPFATSNGALYTYSSSERDLSNSKDYVTFFQHYEFIVREIGRITMPGRISAVHCMDVPRSNSGCDSLIDFPGDIIRLHEFLGWEYIGRHCIWKEPLTVRNRTMQKNLAHKTLVEDSTLCGLASADYLLLFRNRGKNQIPVSHPTGLEEYVGERRPPVDILRYRGYKGKQTENRFSHWCWRQYASSFWDDIRLDNVLHYREARDEEDEKHVHALQLDVIERCVILRSNPGEIVLTPFMGVGSEVYGAVKNGRKGIGIELKSSYYRQAIKNLESIALSERDQMDLVIGEPMTAQIPL